MMDIPLLHNRIVARPEEFLAALFGERTRRTGESQWRVGSRGSLSIEIKEQRLVFYDHEAAIGGDAIDLWQRERDGTPGSALKEIASWGGLEPLPNGSAPSARPIVQKSKCTDQRVVPPIPTAALQAWYEGQEWLWDGRSFNQSVVNGLATWRGWPVEYVRTLIASGTLAAPLLWSGERARAAFPIFAPMTWEPADNDGYDVGRPDVCICDRGHLIGFHARRLDDLQRNRGWVIVPKRDDSGPEQHPGVPLLPLILAGHGARGSL